MTSPSTRASPCSPGNWLSLDYEHHDVRFRRSGWSPICGMTSADRPHAFVPGLPHLPRLNLSRLISRTNPCTKPVHGLRLPGPGRAGLVASVGPSFRGWSHCQLGNRRRPALDAA